MNGPNVLCVFCGGIANHTSLMCEACRDLENKDELTQADLAYVLWKRKRDALNAAEGKQ